MESALQTSCRQLSWPWWANPWNHLLDILAICAMIGHRKVYSYGPARNGFRSLFACDRSRRIMATSQCPGATDEAVQSLAPTPHFFQQSRSRGNYRLPRL